MIPAFAAFLDAPPGDGLVLVNDDGSRDETLAILRAFAERTGGGGLGRSLRGYIPAAGATTRAGWFQTRQRANSPAAATGVLLSSRVSRTARGARYVHT